MDPNNHSKRPLGHHRLKKAKFVIRAWGHHRFMSDTKCGPGAACLTSGRPRQVQDPSDPQENKCNGKDYNLPENTASKKDILEPFVGPLSY